MEEVKNKRVETHKITGYYLEVQNYFGSLIRVRIEEQQSQKTFVADLSFDSLPQTGQLLFPLIDDLYDHIKECIESEIDLLKILPNGSLQVREVHKNRVRKVIIPTVQKDEATLERLQRRNDRLSKTIRELRNEAKHQKQQLLDRIDQIDKKGDQIVGQIRLEISKHVNDEIQQNQKFKDHLSEQLRRVKQQVLNRVQLPKRTSQNSRQQLQERIKIEWQNKLDESERKSAVAIEETKQECKRVQTEQRQRVFRANEQIRRLTETLATKQSSQAMRENLDIFSSKAEVNKKGQVTLQDKEKSTEVKLQRHLSMRETKYPFAGARRVSFAVDTSLKAFKENWKIDKTSKIIERTTDNCFRQLASKNELPKTGKYYFEVRCINRLSPSFGIVTNSCRHKEWVYLEYDQYIRLFYDGAIQQNGINKKTVKCKIKDGNLVTVLVDKQKPEISWFVNRQFIASAKLAQCFQTKPIYAFLGQGYYGNRYQCIE